MTYILNVLVVDDAGRQPLSVGPVYAELDDPPGAALALAHLEMSGTRYLVVLDDADRYRSSMSLVNVPAASSGPATLAVPERVLPEFRKLVRELWMQSGTHSLAVYLEANRIISRPPDENDLSPQVTIVRHAGLDDLFRTISTGGLQEEEVHVVDG